MPRYIPEPTPTSDDIAELQRYIDQELQRISDAVNVKVDGAYGGIFQDPGLAIITPMTPAFVLFDVFDVVIPVRPDGIIGDPALASIQVLTPGSFIVNFTTTVVNIPPNAEWEFELAANGVGTGLGGVVEPSNQTETVTISFNIIVLATKGDFLTIVVNSPTSTALNVVSSEFIAHRVSEEFS